MKHPIQLGSRLETFIDDWIVDSMDGLTRVMHRPSPQNTALIFDAPWEGNTSGYVTVFQDHNLFRMYYRGSRCDYSEGQMLDGHELTCYAESTDGITWEKPSLGLVEFNGSKDNNIIWDGPGDHNFAPFKDTNPECKPEHLYKALGSYEYGPADVGKKQGLWAFQSPDGINWSMVSEYPIITKGVFDSHNLAFWDSVKGEYREYHRDFYDGVDDRGNRNGRDIMTAVSKNFHCWPDPEWLNYSPGSVGELYTNQIIPYYRAPHIYLGFPTRYTDRGWKESTKLLPQLEYRRTRASMSEREGTAVTDGMLMSSRDGKNFNIWPEAFLRPGLKTTGNWFYGDNYQNHGLIQTKSTLEGSADEISIFSTEDSHQSKHISRLRRHTLRIDGFVSIQANFSGGEFFTRPLIFDGNKLAINFSGSAASTIRVEIQTPSGYTIPEFSLDRCDEVFGDDLGRVVSWYGNVDLSRLSGAPVRLRFLLKDADLYSFQFQK